MARYRQRLERDLDDWIGRGLVPADSRAAILATVGEERRLDAATALAVIGGLLAGVAVIAFVAANWPEIPRLARFALVLALFLGTAGAAAWANARGRMVTGHVLLSVASLVFAAAIGLTGQIFDIAGDPQAALRAAGLAAALLAVAGRSPWAAAVSLVLLAFGDFTGRSAVGSMEGGLRGWLIFAAPMGVGLGLAWRSQALAHVAGVAALLAVTSFDSVLRSHAEQLFLGAAATLAVAGIGARFLRDRFEAPAGVLYGWFVCGALIWFGIAGLGGDLRGVGHSVAWLALSAGVVASGRHDRHAMVTAAGVVGLIAAAATLLFNLGVGLMTSAAVFGAAAIAALVIAWAMRRRATA